MYFKRFIEDDLYAWKANPEHKVAFVRGCRQVGKTTTIEHFVQSYKNVVKINTVLDGEVLESLLRKHRSNLAGVFSEFCSQYGIVFTDDNDTVIFIDEIQENRKVYESIRFLNRELHCDVIVTGSYLEEALKYFQPAGDTDVFTMYPLSFEEFLEALNAYRYFKETDFNCIEQARLDWVNEAWHVYCNVGGYPAAVLSFLKNESVESTLDAIVNTLITEICDRVESIEERQMVRDALPAVIDAMLREKKGDSDLITNISKITSKYSSYRISTKECYSIISWLRQAGFLSYCDKVDLGTGARYSSERIFFRDLGVLNYLLRTYKVDESDRNGLLAETFVFKILEERNFFKDFYYDKPAFAVFEGYELDFSVVSKYDDLVYGIEVKYGNNKGTSIKKALSKRYVDVAVVLKNSGFGETEDTVTIPLPLAWKFKFNKGKRVDRSLPKLSAFSDT
ncbi:ATP-binding protein [Acetivibrio ethanolgignens]|uniref:AAA+ family ATPase n=1 Tax=Acetivibrio ethanolgignens TaxID=290052 RepID=A0A0V8QEE0_9FIRM|nr:AAA family ATPase [Acetivibrio ethanolgignens]KSV58755.1 hypothetical protein ASU35_11875 [Acetivibrio ethanolgignens]